MHDLTYRQGCLQGFYQDPALILPPVVRASIDHRISEVAGTILELGNRGEENSRAAASSIQELSYSQAQLVAYEAVSCSLDEKLLRELLKRIPNKDQKSLLSIIQNFERQGHSIFFKELTQEIAKKAPWILASNIQAFGIQSPVMLIDLARKIVQEAPRELASNIKNFKIQDQGVLIELMRIIVQEDPKGFIMYIKNFGIQDQSILIELTTTLLARSPKELISHISNFCFTKELLKDSPLGDLRDKIKGSPIRQQQILFLLGQCLFSSRAVLDDYALRSSESKQELEELTLALKPLKKGSGAIPIKEKIAVLTKKITTLDALPSLLLKIASYGNFYIAISLMRIFCDNLLNNYIILSSLEIRKHAQLPMIFVSSWGLQETPKFQAFLTSPGMRADFHVIGGIQSLILNFLQKLDLANLSVKKKIDLLEKCSVTDDIAEAKHRIALMQTLLSLGREDLLKTSSPEPSMLRTLESQVIRTLEENGMLNLSTIQNFGYHYNTTFGTYRNPNSLFIYAGKLKELKDSSVACALQRYTESVLTGNFKKNRYRTTDNPHLQMIDIHDNQVLLTWQKGLIPLEITSGDHRYQAIDTDDSEDLFLCGTEVEGSCLRIDGEPVMTKSLLAYLIDGKNRIIAIKDENGAIKARCILRLLWDPSGNKPVLFQEKNYSNISDPVIMKTLNRIAALKAIQLELSLLTMNERDDLDENSQEAVSLGSPAPYEFVDALGLETNGSFRIDGRLVNLVNPEKLSLCN